MTHRSFAVLTSSFGFVLSIVVVFFSPLKAQSTSQDKNIVELRDFRNDELKSAGFSLSRDTKLHITALGGGE
ncbi:MAG: hypothetical protein HY562_05495, partial [Ignavibacteriales bacterium]|nr:hypothetical protein [Ignavibacteriales bacterium]